MPDIDQIVEHLEQARDHLSRAKGGPMGFDGSPPNNDLYNEIDNALAEVERPYLIAKEIQGRLFTPHGPWTVRPYFPEGGFNALTGFEQKWQLVDAYGEDFEIYIDNNKRRLRFDRGALLQALSNVASEHGVEI